MAKYDVTVDTRDMANKIDTVSNKVSGVTTAVVARRRLLLLPKGMLRTNCANGLIKAFSLWLLLR